MLAIFVSKNPSPAGSREIIRACTTIYQPGDYNSVAYRIPAVITAKAEGVKEVNVFDMTGRLVKTQTGNMASQVNIDVSKLSSGAYLIEGIDVKSIRRQGRFIKQGSDF